MKSMNLYLAVCMMLVLVGAMLGNAQTLCALSALPCNNGTCIEVDNNGSPADFCSCYSGYQGASCDVVINPANCPASSWGSLQNLVTSHFPFVESPSNYTGFNAGFLDLEILGPVVQNRLNTQIFLQNVDADPCRFPTASPTSWVKSEDGSSSQRCYDVWRSHLPWADTRTTCQWTADLSDPTQTVYKADLLISHIDAVSSFRGVPITRSSSYLIPVKVTFQNQVVISTVLTVQSPVALLAAITRQEYLTSNSSAVIEITTSLQWPYRLDLPAVLLLPNGIAAAVSDVSDLIFGPGSCANSTNAVCTQVFRLDLAVLPTQPKTCSFSGNYTLGSVVDCRGADADCPLPAGSAPVALVALIQSEDFCTSVDVDIGLSGTLSVYRDAPRLIAGATFNHDSRAYFRADLSVDENAATISASRFINIRVDSAAAPSIFLMVDQTVQPQGLDADLQLDFGGAGPQVGFSMLVTDALMPVAVDESKDFSVTALVEVDYLENQRTSKRIFTLRLARAVPGGGSQDVGDSVDMVIGGRDFVFTEDGQDGSGPSSSSASSELISSLVY